MGLLNGLSVSQRLSLGFGAITLLIASLVGMVWWQLVGIHADMVEVIDDRYPKIDQARDFVDSVNTQARTLRNVIIATGVEQADELERSLKRMQAAEKDSQDRIEKLRARVDGPEAQQLLQALLVAHEAFRQARDQALNLVRNGQWQEAGRYTMTQVRIRQDALFAATDKVVEFQQGLMARSSSITKEALAHTITLLISVSVAVILVSLLTAFTITRSLLRDLGGEPAAAREAMRRISGGDLTGTVPGRPGDTRSLLGALRQMQGELVGVVTQVRQGSETVATAAQQIAHGNQDLSGRTEEQASALQQTSATMEQLGGTVGNNADNARQADQLARAAAGLATRGGEVVAQVVGTMRGISDSSRRIGDIIGVIDGIAFQTNILALNAAVEAARAGEQGRGFAVVAGEVRTLAQRSAEAAREIKSLIGSNVQQVEHGAGLVDDAGRTMHEIVSSIQRVSDIVAEISSASVQQRDGVQQVGDAVSQMDQTTQQNAALVEEAAAAADSLKRQAQSLLAAMSFFKVGDGTAR